MTIKEAQLEVDHWIKSTGVRYFNELTNLAILTEEVGELARIMARKYGEQSFKKNEMDSAMAAEHLYQGAQGDLFSYLSGSCHFNRLKRLNIVKDIEYCLTLDQFEVIPVLNGTELVKGNF